MTSYVRRGCGLEHWAWPAVPKGTWGPPGWSWLEELAETYPVSPTIPDARIAYRRLLHFISNLPCDECRYHAMCYVLQNPPALASTHTFRSWVWRFHNDVNIRLGKPFYPYWAYQGRARRALSR